MEPREGEQDVATSHSGTVRGLFLELLANNDGLADLTAADRRAALQQIARASSGDGAAVALAIAEELADEIDAYGVVTPLMHDERVSDILINGPDEVWVERAGRLEMAPIRFPDAERLWALVERVFSRGGRRLDASLPIGDVVLDDGSRCHAVLPPIAHGGPVVSIRRFATRLTLDDLVACGTFAASEAAALVEAVRQRRTIVIAGATGSGKTTLLRALLEVVPANERIVLIEETPELRPSHPHVICLATRSATYDGVGGIDAGELVRAALRMRPDRIVLGEARGAEALVALEAMATGHEGSLLTLHARSIAEVGERWLTLALQDRRRPSETAVRRRIDHALDVVVHVERGSDGSRRGRISI